VKEQLNENMIPGVCPGCQLVTVAWMEASERNYFSADIDLVEDYVRHIKVLCGDTSPSEL
jgi:hypothetical protein